MNTQQIESTTPAENSWLRLVADRTQLYVGYQGLDRRFRYVNQKYCDWFKLSYTDIVGKTLEEIAISPSAYAAVEPYETRALKGEHVKYELKLPEPQVEQDVSFSCEFIPYTDPKTGKVVGIVTIAHDVTEQERNVAAIKAAELRFRSITNAIPQLMWTATADGQTNFVNDRCLAYSGVTSIEQYEKKWPQSIHPEDRNAVFSAWKKSIETSEPFKLEYRLANHQGIYRWFLGHAVPIRNESGIIEYWIGTATDIEQERTREHELQQAKLLAEDANRAKSSFLANMSHEIRTPLSAILGFSELLKNDLDAAERLQFAEIIERNGKMLTRIIDDLLDLARVEAGRLVIDSAKFRLRDLINDVLALFTDRASKKNIQIKVHFNNSTPEMIESDPVRLRQILINLIGNAVKFTDAGNVSIDVVTKNNANGSALLSFIIKDTGCGLTEDQACHLFRPFTQADPSSTRRYGGTGLGLALASRLAEALGGKVELRESVLGVGSTFVASILTKQFVTGEDLQNKNKSSMDDSNPEFLKGIKILAVDDSIDNLELLKHMLIARRAMVDISTSGEFALQLASRNPYDLVIMDLQMPNMDGYQTLSALRKMGYQKPVIAFTAHALTEEYQRTQAAGFTHHLTKPLDKTELYNLVAKHGRC